MIVKFFCDAGELLKSILAADLTVAKAARQAGISDRQLGKLLTGKRRVQVKTAGRLRRAFGDHVVRTMPPDLKKGV